MGQHARALLMYGYDLGAEGRGFREAETSDENPYGYIKTAWYDEEAADQEDDEDAPCLTERIYKALYDAIPGPAAVTYSHQREKPVHEHYGVRLESHCHHENPHWALVTCETRVEGAAPELLDLPALQAQAQAEEWDGKLAAALAVLGITPVQDQPGWILAADYG